MPRKKTDLAKVETRLTQQQMNWLAEQSQTTGEPIASVIRQLVHDAMAGKN